MGKRLRILPAIALELAQVGRQDTAFAQFLGKDHQRRVGEIHRQVTIAVHQNVCSLGFLNSRDGVIPIELIDGDRLVERFERVQLGVKAKQSFVIDQAFFDEFRRQ